MNFTEFHGVFDPQSSRQGRTQNFSFEEGGELMGICNLRLIKKKLFNENHVKSPSRQFIRLKRNLKLTKRISTYF
jgi:hypothetical protein